MRSFKQFINEASSRFVYHVTFTTHVKKIKSGGLKPLQPSNWGSGGERYNTQGGVFAFDHPEDAFKWAFKQQYEFNKPVSIIKIKKGKTWELDPSDDPSLQMGKGKALQSLSAIKSSEIVKVFDYKDFSNPHELGIPQDKWIKGIVKTLSESKIIKAFTNKEDAMQSQVTKHAKGWAVSLYDMDSEQHTGQVRIFPDKDKAIAYAKTVNN